MSAQRAALHGEMNTVEPEVILDLLEENEDLFDSLSDAETEIDNLRDEVRDLELEIQNLQSTIEGDVN